MQIKPLGAAGDIITGISGTQYAYSSITFDSSNYTFSYNDGSGTQDITSDIKRADALTFPGFDPTVANNWMSYRAGRTTVVDQAGISPGAELNTNVVSLTAQGIGQEVSNIGSSVTSNFIKPVLYIAGGLILLKILTSKK